MAKNTRLHLIHDSDGQWEGLYRNGSLLYEGHRISLDLVLSMLQEIYGFEYARTTTDILKLPEENLPKQESKLNALLEKENTQDETRRSKTKNPS